MTTEIIRGDQLNGMEVFGFSGSLIGAQPVALSAYGVQRLPTDPIGTTTATFSGVHANSEIRVYLPDGTEAAGVENCSVNPALTWNVYSAGNANNVVTVRIVNVAYKIKEFNYTSTLGNVSIPIQQELDPWYSNP